MKEYFFPFYNYSSYLKKKYNCAAYRVSVDAGFSCPNRGQDRRDPGCTYCDGYGSKAVYLRNKNGQAYLETPPKTLAKLEEQIKMSVAFLQKRYKAQAFLLYFQAFSNTFGPVKNLKKIYDYCLCAAPFKELIVSTRPDCISPDNAELLSSYKKHDFDVWVELGLQSASDKTLERIKRGHTLAHFNKAYTLLKTLGIKVAVHLIFGLPGEGMEDILKTIDYIAGLAPDGVKIHNLHIPDGTEMYNEYLCGELSVPASLRHREYTIKALERLPSETIIMRLTCDTPENHLAAPRNFMPKGTFYNSIREEMIKRETYQSKYFISLK